MWIQSAFGTFLLASLLGKTKTQVTLADRPVAEIYLCSKNPVTITCDYGFVVEIQDGVTSGRVDAGCSIDTIASDPKACTKTDPLDDRVQKFTCANKNSCPFQDITGQAYCSTGPTNYAVLKYICKFVGYDGMSSPKPTTTATTTSSITGKTTNGKTSSQITTAITTKTSSQITTTVTTKTSSHVPDLTTKTNESSIENVTSPDTSVSPVTNRPTSTESAAQASGTQGPLTEKQKTQVILGVSISAVVLFLLIILLVECKRQNREKSYSDKQPIQEDNESPSSETESSPERTPYTAEQTVDVDDEIAIINKEPERRFKKKGETDKAYENHSLPDKTVPSNIPVEDNHNQGYESLHSGRSGRDSGVSVLFSDEAQPDVMESDQSHEESEMLETTPESERAVRRVTFNDMETNTELTAVKTTPPQPIEGITRNPSVSGPSNEEEILY